jgi:signal transduction histidine kinase
MTRSLTQLAVAADAVAHGDLDQRLESKGDDEVARVSRAFNSMTDSLRRMIRERSQGEALAAMGELAAVLAHQVRSPLTAMRIDLQRVEGRVGADGDRELVGRAIQQLDRLERSVGGALRIAKSAAGTFEMVDLHAPLGRAISGLEHQVRARGTVLESSDDANGRLTIRGDAATLEQLFANIILNAAEATEGGRITVRSLRENGRVTVLVEDTGIGMAADTLGRIFEPYYSTKPDGTGIGLAVAQRIVKAHGGDIAITSEAGHGTRVTVSFAAIDSTPG